MTHQGWDVQLTAYAARDWRANFFPVGIAHLAGQPEKVAGHQARCGPTRPRGAMDLFQTNGSSPPLILKQDL